MNWLLIFNSFGVSIAATLIAVSLGFFSALWAAGASARWRNLFLIVAIVALALPPFLVTNGWLHLLGNAGVWRSWLPFNILSLPGAVWILSLMLWPISFFLTFAALRRIEKSYFEFDSLLRGKALIRHLLLPMARTELIQAFVLTFVLALNNFAVPTILQVKVFTEEVWVDFNTTFNYSKALLLSWPLILAPLSALYIFRNREIFWSWRQESVSAKAFQRQLGKGNFTFCAIVAAWAVLFSVGLPFGQLCISSQTWKDFAPAFLAGREAILHSFLFAIVAASLVLVVALLTSRLPLGTLVWLPFLAPGVLLGMGLIWTLNRPPFVAFYQSIGIVFVAFVIRYLAPGWNVTSQALCETDRNLNDAARMEGANAWQLFRHVQLPQIFSQLGAAWYVTYLLCLWDVETLIFIVPPGNETVSLRIFNLLHYGHNSQVNALCFLLLLLAILPLGLWLAGRRIANSRWPIAVASISMMFAGCAQSDLEGKENKFPVQSRFFSHVETIGSRGVGTGQFNKPRSLALDKDDNLFVVDMTGRVQKFSPKGEYLLSWQMPETTLGKAKGMSRDNAGNIVVVEPHYQRVNYFAPDGKLVAQWGKKGTNVGELVLPRSIAVNSKGENIVSEYTTVDRVQIFSADGQRALHIFGKSGAGDGEFNRPEGVGLDTKDQIYVADSCNHRVQLFSPEGKFITSFGKAGSRLGELSYPYDVRVDSAGLQYVCEFGNSRIQIFDVNHQPIETLGSAGAEPGQLANPWSIALDSHGNLFVADSQNHRVQKFVRKAGARTASSASSWKNTAEAKQRFTFYQSDSNSRTRLSAFLK